MKMTIMRILCKMAKCAVDEEDADLDIIDLLDYMFSLCVCFLHKVTVRLTVQHVQWVQE